MVEQIMQSLKITAFCKHCCVFFDRNLLFKHKKNEEISS